MTDTKPSPASPGRPSAADPVVSARAVTSAPKSAFVEATLQAVDALDCEALAIGLTSDVRPLAGLAGVVDWRMCGRLSDMLRKGVVTGQAKEKVLVPTLGMIPAKRIFLFGWGPKAGLLDGATEKMAWMVDVLQKAKVEKVAIALPEPASLLLGLVDDHIRKPLGDKCGTLFAPDGLAPETPAKDTRPIPMPSFSGPGSEKKAGEIRETSRPDLNAPPKEAVVKSSPRPKPPEEAKADGKDGKKDGSKDAKPAADAKDAKKDGPKDAKPAGDAKNVKPDVKDASKPVEASKDAPKDASKPAETSKPAPATSPLAAAAGPATSPLAAAAGPATSPLAAAAGPAVGDASKTVEATKPAADEKPAEPPPGKKDPRLG